MTYPGAIHRDSGEEVKRQSLTADRLDFLFTTRPLPCPYLPEKIERKIVVALADDRAGKDYKRLISAGYRRSGSIAYRHACPTCRACVPVRLPIADFTPSKSLRRVARANNDLDVRILPPEARADHFDLFTRYQDGRHGGGEMADMDYAEYLGLIEDSPVTTRIAEFRDSRGVLLAACLFDELADSLSAVYTFFEPCMNKRSLGSFMILWLVKHGQENGKSDLYLGYWIGECAKMAYKARFRPLEMLDRGVWRRML
ncbi:MAG: arginyltransferase [Proteobacteria bacterium]|nr:arginyltransferase [Pseudomonadota bacterium]MDA1355503.1 arginyltransferase [Pseudomonadota bacterium]